MLATYLSKEESIIRKNILKMGHETQKAIEKAMKCYISSNTVLADDIIKNDKVINELESRVELECIKVIARQQPVALDLRELLADMSIAKELERIADYAVSIAKIAKKQNYIDPEIESEVIKMSEKCIYMLSEVLISYADKNAIKADTVALLDNEIDDLEHQLNDRVFKLIIEQSEKAVDYTYQLWIIHQLERIGDRVTNIAESIVFLSTGKVVNFD
jgi:phosphate transport system protein